MRAHRTSHTAYVPCGCGRLKTKAAITCRVCRYPNPGMGISYQCPTCTGPKAPKAKHCKFCWPKARRGPTKNGRLSMTLELTPAVVEGLDLLAREWAVGRAAIIYRLVLAAARQTEREMERSA